MRTEPRNASTRDTAEKNDNVLGSNLYLPFVSYCPHTRKIELSSLLYRSAKTSGTLDRRWAQ